MKKFLSCVITSDNTWHKIETLGLVNDLRNARNKCDLAFVLNGNDPLAVNYLKTLSPEFLFTRENLGMDPAAIEFLLKRIPAYDWTIILHDDHFFDNPNWIDSLEKIIMEKPGTDILGNFVPITVGTDFIDYVENKKYGFEIDSTEINILQAMAGAFSKKAIDKLKSINFGFELTNDKRIAEFSEWIFSVAIERLNLETANFTNEVFDFLKHTAENEKSYLYWNGFLAFSERDYASAEKFLIPYLEKYGNNDNGMNWFIYGMLTVTSFNLTKYEETLRYAEKTKEYGIINSQIEIFERKAKELANV